MIGFAGNSALGHDFPSVPILPVLWKATQPSEQVGYVPGELIVGIGGESEERLQELIKSWNGVVLEELPEIHAFLVKVDDRTVPVTPYGAKAYGAFDYIERNYYVHATFAPNDPLWSLQWALPKVRADLAWDIQLGRKSVIVAVIDTGMDYNHPDLTQNYLPGGYDWVNHDSFPLDDNGHGTHVAGIIGAVTDNGVGVAGLAQVSTMAEKVLDSSGLGTVFDVAEGVVDAANKGARITNNSYGTYGAEVDVMRAAFKYAWERGTLNVAAAGNDNTDQPFYPAAFSEFVISVAGTDQNDERWLDSNHGDWIELSAPAVDIISTLPGDSYGYLSGTSMSSAFVAGAAALVWGHDEPLSADQVRWRLQESATDLGTAGRDPLFGFGRIDLFSALELPKSIPVGGEIQKTQPTVISILGCEAIALTVCSIAMLLRYDRWGRREGKSSRKT